MFSDIADILVLGAARQVLSPITSSAAVTASLGAGVLRLICRQLQPSCRHDDECGTFFRFGRRHQIEAFGRVL